MIKKASLFHTAVLSIHLYSGQINHTVKRKGKSSHLQKKIQVSFQDCQGALKTEELDCDKQHIFLSKNQWYARVLVNAGRQEATSLFSHL